MPPETTEEPNLPTTTADGSHVPSADVPDDPSANASAEIFAAMNGSTLTEAGDNEEYGGEQVLATPTSNASWLLPTFAVVGGLALLGFAGRRWIVRGRAATVAPVVAHEDETYADKLDDELRDTD